MGLSFFCLTTDKEIMSIQDINSRLNIRESWAVLAIVRNHLGMIEWPKAQIRWASEMRPVDARQSEPEWVPADAQYQTESRARIINQADAYITAIENRVKTAIPA
jgi:hypothetical protein